MTLYLLVVGLACSCPWFNINTQVNSSPTTTEYIRTTQGNLIYTVPKCDGQAPRVDFFLSQTNAAKEYAAQPSGSARLFMIRAWRHWDEPSILELNVLPAQSYRVLDKARIEANP